jgi:16S rRNA (cytosine967-C5)-methyltransferase
MKWKFTLEMLERIIQEQREIFGKALEFLNPRGKIVYATCSIFPEENEEQIAFFQKQYNLELVGEPFRSFPQKGGMDGFFGAVLQKNKS